MQQEDQPDEHKLKPMEKDRKERCHKSVIHIFLSLKYSFKDL